MRDIIRYLRNSPLTGIGTEAEAAGGGGGGKVRGGGGGGGGGGNC